MFEHYKVTAKDFFNGYISLAVGNLKKTFKVTLNNKIIPIYV